MVQWLSRWIHNAVFPGSNPGAGKVDSAFHPFEVCEMSSSIINAAQVCRVVRIVRDPPGELLRQVFECTQVSMCCRIGLLCIMRLTLCGVVMGNCACL